MTALEAFLTVGGIVMLGVGIRLGFDFSRHARWRRMAAALKAGQLTAGDFIAQRGSPTGHTFASDGGERTRNAGAAPHAAVEPPVACPDMGTTHIGAGASGGKATGSGVNPAGRRMMPAPQRCIRCRLYHLHLGSLLCEACEAEREATANVQREGGAE